MLETLNRLSAAARRFSRRDEGTATVEAVLWFPIFALIFGLMVDTAMIFHGQTKVLRVIQDGNRKMAVGYFKVKKGETATEEEKTSAYIESVLSGLNINADATTTTVAGVAFTNVEVSASQFQLLGFFSTLMSLKLNVTSEHMLEHWEA